MRPYLKDPQGCPFVFAPFAIEPVRGMRPDIEMKKGLAEAETGEASRMRRCCERARIVLVECDVEGELLVQRQRRAADAGVVQRAAMARIDVQRRVQRNTQAFECIERVRPDINLAAVTTGDGARGDMRPAFGIPGRGDNRRDHLAPPAVERVSSSCSRTSSLAIFSASASATA